MATLNGLPISVPENMKMQEIAFIFELNVKNNILSNEIRKLERETGLSDYQELKVIRERLNDRNKVCGLPRLVSHLADDYEAYARASERFRTIAR